jgi:hypothetical protein
MISRQIPNPDTLEYTLSLHWSTHAGDIAFTPNFFESTKDEIQKLIKRIEKQQETRARRLGHRFETTKSSAASEEASNNTRRPKLVFRRTDNRRLALPNLKLLGEGGAEAAWMIPRFNDAMQQLGPISHEAVTLPLEDGMDM